MMMMMMMSEFYDAKPMFVKGDLVSILEIKELVDVDYEGSHFRAFFDDYLNVDLVRYNQFSRVCEEDVNVHGDIERDGVWYNITGVMDCFEGRVLCYVKSFSRIIDVKDCSVSFNGVIVGTVAGEWVVDECS